MNFKRFYAVFTARSIEFFRDRASLSWNLVFPVLLLAGFSFIFSEQGRPEYKIGLISSISDNSVSNSAVSDSSIESSNTAKQQAQFKQIRFIEFVEYANPEKAADVLAHHGIDLVVDFSAKRYWVNEESAKSYLAEKILLGQTQDFTRLQSSGKKIRYVDWVLPGVLGMNMMFSCLFGVGYVIVRYRKNSVLKRLKATPLTALEFVSAQLLSRLVIVMFTSVVVYTGCNLFFNFFMLGNYFDLLIIGTLGAFCLISLGLLVASKSKSQELVGGLLNITSWPMMMLSGVWFSLEGAPELLKTFANFLPLTHVVAGARAIITEGATLSDISFHVNILILMSVLFLGLGAYLFSWNTER